MKAVIYIRVSSEEQFKEGFSVEAQTALLHRKCLEWDYTIVKSYSDDASAKNMNRKGLQQLMKDAESNLFEVIVYWRLDRLTRSSKDFHKLVERLAINNVGIKSATENIDTTTAIGRFQLELSVSLAQLERETISERVAFVMQEGVRQGKWYGGPVPFGYTWNGSTMLIEEAEAETIRLLRDLYLQGNGFFTVAKNLNALGRLRKGFKWTSQSVWYVLDNPIYAGKLRYGSKKKNGKYATRKKTEIMNCIWSDSNFPTIFTWEEYQEHNNRMVHRQFYGHTKIKDYWFAGIIRCARCGSAMTGRPHRNPLKDGTRSLKVVYYMCGKRQNGTGCTMPMLRQELAEQLILNYIRDFKTNVDKEKEVVPKIKKVVANHDNELFELNKKLTSIFDRRKKWQYMFAEDLISEADFKLRRSEEDSEEKIIKERMVTLKSENMGMNLNTMNLMFGLLELWNVMEDKDRNIVAQNIFKSIVFECYDKNPIGKKGKYLDFRIESVDIF